LARGYLQARSVHLLSREMEQKNIIERYGHKQQPSRIIRPQQTIPTIWLSMFR
jgi:hypothetical protein